MSIIEGLGIANVFLFKSNIWTRNAEAIQNAESKIMSIYGDASATKEIILECRTYSVKFARPNIESFEIRVDQIYKLLATGKSWEEIKQTIQE